MVTIDTKYISPHPVLQPYVRYFAIRKFDTSGEKFNNPIYAEHKMAMTFFIRSKLFGFNALDKMAFKAHKKGIPKCPIQGIQTFTKGFAVFKGVILLLTIHFHPAGIFHIFNIRADELFDKIYESKDVLPIESETLQEQLVGKYCTFMRLLRSESFNKGFQGVY